MSPGPTRHRSGETFGPFPPFERPSSRPDRVRPELPLVKLEVAAGSERHWIREVTERWSLKVRFNVCRPTGPGLSRLLQVVELVGDPGELGAAERYLRHHAGIEALTMLVLSPSRRFVRAITAMPESCRSVMEGGAVCASCQFSPGTGPAGKDRWTLVVPRTPEALRRITGLRSGSKRSRTPILGMRRFVPDRTLTPRQATALESAYRLGFYAFPRRTNLKEISRILGVSRSTTAELLRRAESKMFTSYLGNR